MALIVVASACLEAATANSHVILTDLTAADPYYRAVDELTRFRPATHVLQFHEQDVDSLIEALRREQPRYVTVVAAPTSIDANLASRMFRLSTLMNDDALMDFGYGFITGATAEEAVGFVRNIARAESEWASLPRRFVGVAQRGSAIGLRGSMSGSLVKAMQAYGECFRVDGWETKVLEWEPGPSGVPMPADAISPAVLGGSRLVFIAGHGGPTWAAGIRAADLANVDCYPAVVLCGGCETGVVNRWLSMQRDKTIGERFVQPSDTLSLRLIRQGAVAVMVGVRSHNWADCAPVVYPFYAAGRSLGDAMVPATNQYLRSVTSVWAPVLTPGKPDETYETWNTTYLRRSTFVLYGDPAYVPFPQASEQHHGLPEDFDPFR